MEERGRQGRAESCYTLYLYRQFMPVANIIREQPEKLELSSLIIVFY